MGSERKVNAPHYVAPCAYYTPFVFACMQLQAAQPQDEAEPHTAETGKGAEEQPGAKASPEGAEKASASNLFGAFGKRHYEGGFDEKMTRKEAALILGVRESAAPQRIKACMIQ